MDGLNKALKDWAVVIHALGTGEQIVLIRKGGKFIAEEKGIYKIAHNEFFLYPTYSSQRKEEIKEEYHGIFEESVKYRLPGKVRIEYLAKCEEIIEVDSLEKLKKLSNYYIWSLEHVEKWFKAAKEQKAYVLILRVYKLPEPKIFEVTRSMAVSMSWVNLPTTILTQDCIPVLEDEKYNQIKTEIKNILEKAPLPPTPPPKEYMHSKTVKEIKEIGNMFNFIVKTEEISPDKAYRWDVTWRDIETHSPFKVFEVELSRNIDHALSSLAHAYDLWRPELCLIILDEKDKNRVEKLVEPKVKGAFSRISKKLRIYTKEEINKLYQTLKPHEGTIKNLTHKPE